MGSEIRQIRKNIHAMNVWLLNVWQNGYDYVLASNVREARKIVADHNNFKDPYMYAERIAIEGNGWKVLPHDKKFKIKIENEYFNETPIFWAMFWQEPVYLSKIKNY